MFDILRIAHVIADLPGPVVCREGPVPVCGGRYDSFRSDSGRYFFGQRVGASKMPAEHGNYISAAVIHNDDSGIFRLIFDIWRDCPHRDPGRADKDQRVRLPEGPGGPLVQCYAGRAADSGDRPHIQFLPEQHPVFAESSQINDLFLSGQLYFPLFYDTADIRHTGRPAVSLFLAKRKHLIRWIRCFQYTIFLTVRSH